jgi:hypothetical protein
MCDLYADSVAYEIVLQIASRERYSLGSGVSAS